MKYSLNWIKDLFDKKEKIKFLFFWGHQPAKDGSITSSCLSQWWPSHFSEENITYKTAEHYMMAGKAKLFNDTDAFEKIIACHKPGEAKKLGRTVKGFDENVWLKHRYQIVLKASLLKFSQNPELKTFLINTSNRVIVEASPLDKIWGIGMACENKDIEDPHRWKGLNLLGFALMGTRDILRSGNYKETSIK